VSVISTNASLGLTSGAIATAGSDVVGSIGGLPATGSGQLLTGTGAASGLALEITGTTIGNRGVVHFTRGAAGRLDALLSEFLASDGQLTTKTDSLNSQIEEINQQRELLAKRVAAVEQRYRTQFETMDVLLGQLQVTSDYLEQQLSTLPKIGE
ncbi:MAG: flagellar hook protein, partial [Gammaproteobacteria bacterium]